MTHRNLDLEGEFFAVQVSRGRQTIWHQRLFLVGDLRETERRKFVSYFNIRVWIQTVFPEIKRRSSCFLFCRLKSSSLEEVIFTKDDSQNSFSFRSLCSQNVNSHDASLTSAPHLSDCQTLSMFVCIVFN